MKKNNGSITPETKRLNYEIRITDKLANSIENYDKLHESKYDERFKKIKSGYNKYYTTRNNLNQNEQYFDKGKFKDINNTLDKKYSTLEESLKSIGENKLNAKTSEEFIEKFKSENVQDFEPLLNNQFSRKFKTIEQKELVNSLVFKQVYQCYKQNEPSITTNIPHLYHYGINGENTKFLVGHILAMDVLHPIEKSLIESAISNLKQQSAASDYVKFTAKEFYANNTVLIDIFPRNNEDLEGNCVIALDKKNKSMIETHTIILWKTNGNKLTVIDPTDKTFSQFLHNKTLKGFTIVTNSELPNKIYNSGGKKEKNSRDCVDIAVKLAFELNEKQKEENDLVNTIRKSVDQISNTKLPKKLEFFKLLQSSDYETRKKAKEFVSNEKIIKYNDNFNVDNIKNTEVMDNIVKLCGELEEIN